MIKNENIFFKKLYVVRLEPTISSLTAIGSIQKAKRDSDVYVIRKYISLKSILSIMFANLNLVLRSYTSLYGIFMSASLTLHSYTIKTLLIMHAFHSSRHLQSKRMFYFSHAPMI